MKFDVLSCCLFFTSFFFQGFFTPLYAQDVVPQAILSGPVSGAVTHQSARILIQTQTPEAATLSWTPCKDKSGCSLRLNPDPSRYGFLIFELNALWPSTFYQFEITLEKHPELKVKGSFTTFPQPGEVKSFSFATGSCQETENMKVFDVIHEKMPLFFMHTGDYTYPDYQIAPDYSSNPDLVALSYQKRYNEKRMKEMLADVPIDYVFDDNDHVGGGSGRYCKNGFRDEKKGWFRYSFIPMADTFPDFWLRNVIDGYDYYFPHYPLIDKEEAIHHQFRVGNAEFFVLDRNSSRPQPSHYAFRQTKNGRWVFDPPEDFCMFCPKQMEWLKEGLASSDADWKFIVSGVPMNRNLILLIKTGLAIQRLKAKGHSGFHMASGFGAYWAAYRSEILDFYHWLSKSGVKNIIVISGDTHHNVMDDGKNAGLPEINASGLSVTGTHLAYAMKFVGMVTGRYKIQKHVWNQGGNGLGNKNFKNAFGWITVQGRDYVELSLIDEDDQVISSFRVPFQP